MTATIVAPSNTLVLVDRSKPPDLPLGMKGLVHPELQTFGPAKYDMTEVEMWFHEGQRRCRGMKGMQIYEHLLKTGNLKNCLGLHDAMEIRKNGYGPYRRVFGAHTTLSFWRDVTEDRNGECWVPILYDGAILVDSIWIGADFTDLYPAARFRTRR